jgi:PTS system nitrogen regulatory IIA component
MTDTPRSNSARAGGIGIADDRSYPRLRADARDWRGPPTRVLQAGARLGYLPAPMRIAEFLKVEAVTPALSATSKSDVLRELAKALSRAWPGVPESRFMQVLEEREKLGSTGMEKGVAIPHGRLSELPTLIACFGVSREGVDFEARDGQKSQFFFALVAPENSAGLHLKALSRLSRIFRSDALKDSILAAPDASTVHALLVSEDARA